MAPHPLPVPGSAASGPTLGAIADDVTGGTDLASAFVRAGLRTVQTLGLPTGPAAALLGEDEVDAIVVALKTRTAPAPAAVRESRAAARWLLDAGCRQLYEKYCSTFDSTPAGNIGPVTDALLEETGTDLTVVCPAFPATGRTVYRSHLFVGDQLLSDSGMRSHPLTPMTDSDLRRLLQAQTPSRVGSLTIDVVRSGSEAVRAGLARLRADGVRMVVVDAIDDADLDVLAEGTADLALLTGGSGLGQGLRSHGRRAPARRRGRRDGRRGVRRAGCGGAADRLEHRPGGAVDVRPDRRRRPAAPGLQVRQLRWTGLLRAVLADLGMSASPRQPAEEAVRAGRRLAERGLSPGTSGNLSVRTADGFLATPTGADLGALDAADLAVLDPTGRHVAGPPPTKETDFHLACYRARPAAGAVVHLHSRSAVAVSCLAGLDPRSTIPPLTPYFVMRVGCPWCPTTDPATHGSDRRSSRSPAVRPACCWPTTVPS